MCGRYVSPEESAIERAFHLGRRNNPDPFARRFNVFPTATIPMLRSSADADGPELAAARWGFVPHWWKEPQPPRLSFNARMEEAAQKPMWRAAWARSRCLIPAEGWYEWQAIERADPRTGEIRAAKQPHFIRRADGKLFCFAGLESRWTDPRSGEAISSCAILTAPATGALAAIHDRMPLVLPESAHAAWLDRALTDAREVKTLAGERVPPEAFAHWKVRLLVNNTGLDGPELIEPARNGRDAG